MSEAWGMSNQDQPSEPYSAIKKEEAFFNNK
jgi:hypothetical protein